MAATFELTVAGDGEASSSALAGALRSVEVEENADSPDAMTITLPVNRMSSGDLTYVDDGSFEPYTPVSVVLKAGTSTQCVFDGYVLSWRLHVDRASADSSVKIWAQDASCLMNLNDVVRQWPGLTDGQVANEIFTSYGFSTADANLEDDSPAHRPEQHTLMQRTTDLRFLYGLARRGGKLCRVACGEKPGDRTGYFIRPSGQPPVAAVTLAGPDDWSADALDVEWDVMRPTEVQARQASLFSSAGSAPATEESSGIPALGARNLRSYAGRPSRLLLTATADPEELPQRATAVLAESGWFAACTAEADLDRLGTVLRAGTIVAVDGAGRTHSGNWLVWRVNHLIERDSCRSRFTLVRNAIGPSGATL
ncbi:MAG TPA: contractile injection system protein, VgrG/Pvc8 family [Trebonia sp.]|nr:contractile injection system protein, VgrG/Pvc8 family [Trebonia sp.]